MYDEMMKRWDAETVESLKVTMAKVAAACREFEDQLITGAVDRAEIALGRPIGDDHRIQAEKETRAEIRAFLVSLIAEGLMTGGE